MKGYKLTDENAQTYNGTQWGEGVTHETDGSGDLCGPGWLHYYRDANLAVLLNPTGAAFDKPRLWECEAEGEEKLDHGLKFGCRKLTTIKEIPLPEISVKAKVRFAIYCALEVYTDAGFVAWAQGWLSNRDRTAAAAYAAAAYAANAYAANAYAAAVNAANAYAYAANAAVAYAAANAAAYAAYAADIDLVSIAARAIKETAEEEV